MSRTFSIKQSFKEEDIPKLENGETIHSPVEEHFGVPWKIIISHPGFFRVHLECLKTPSSEKWLIDADIAIRYTSCGTITQIRGTIVFGHVQEFEETKEYSTENPASLCGSSKDDWDLQAEFEREPMKQFSDLALVVEDQKFHVSKLYLATHSKHFEVMLLNEHFKESKMNEISLAGVSSDDFQKYLEVLYGDDAIDETTVEGILLVADMFDTPIVMKKCENFLVYKSEKTLLKRLKMALRYNLKELKKKCNSEVKDVENVCEFLAML